MNYQIQINFGGNWENTVYLPMDKETATVIMESLKKSYPENGYKLIKV